MLSLPLILLLALIYLCDAKLFGLKKLYYNIVVIVGGEGLRGLNGNG